ncbi:hypothetical protein RHGRI_030098 [Rhododendron griersonianum]|uniref:Very-long-chain (3R)-3-hydroxyacyl-CoA dehydratase n=1 Tax=Rhododendron griersonianum TaxID=479676 RepID=A0AAV6IPY1_9ERIC|nr:hypothetical protein RHGRI_030098 [Rhododendron griersonianum]
MLRRWRREAVEEAERGGGVERQSVQWVDFLPLVRRSFQVLYLALKTLKDSGHGYVYHAVEKPLLLAQSAAVLEMDREQILHGLVGLVRSPITATVPQISSRLFVTWGVLWSFPETRTHLLVSLLVISWSITEGQSDPGAINQSCISGTTPMEMGLWVGESGLGPLGFSNICRSIQIIRYSFFGSKEAFGFAPSWIMWLRYSTFLFLYPIGISSEVGLIYFALPYIKESGKYSIRLPNKLNFSLDSFYIAILVLGIYFPGSSHMYTYMIGQRTRALSKLKKV